MKRRDVLPGAIAVTGSAAVLPLMGAFPAKAEPTSLRSVKRVPLPIGTERIVAMIAYKDGFMIATESGILRYTPEDAI